MTDGLTVTRTFASPRERVYEAWTRPEQFSVWFGTRAIEVPLETVSMDVRVGGVWSAVMHLPEGAQISWVGDYTELDPPARLVLTITDRPDEEARGVVTVTFDDAGGSTVMTMTQTGGDFSEEQVAATIVGYNAFFDDMETLLAAQR